MPNDVGGWPVVLRGRNCLISHVDLTHDLAHDHDVARDHDLTRNSDHNHDHNYDYTHVRYHYVYRRHNNNISDFDISDRTDTS